MLETRSPAPRAWSRALPSGIGKQCGLPRPVSDLPGDPRDLSAVPLPLLPHPFPTPPLPNWAPSSAGPGVFAVREPLGGVAWTLALQTSHFGASVQRVLWAPGSADWASLVGVGGLPVLGNQLSAHPRCLVGPGYSKSRSIGVRGFFCLLGRGK